jgi:hypothetical protein
MDKWLKRQKIFTDIKINAAALLIGENKCVNINIDQYQITRLLSK